MKDTITNKITSYNGTLAVADDPEYAPIWQNKPPQAFNDGIATARAAVVKLASDGAEQSVNITGAAAALCAMRKQFETALHPLARATFQCLNNLGRTEDAAKVDLTPSDLHNARAVALAGLGETVLDLAEPLSKAAGAQPAVGDNFGVSAANVTNMDTLWQKYSVAVGAPQGARAKRKALTVGLPGKCAAVETQFAVLDDLIVQFKGTDAGNNFVAAWFNSRHVVDAGHRFEKPAPPDPTPAAK
jgi:hypothetical protein